MTTPAEPDFLRLLRRLGMGTLTFDVPRMGQQGYVPVSEFLKDLDAYIEAKVAAAVAENAPTPRPTLTDLIGPPPGNLTAEEIAARPGVVTIEVGPLPEQDPIADMIGDPSTPVNEALAPTDTPIAYEGPLSVSFWSNDEERIVVRHVESLDAELTEWDEDGAPLWTTDTLIAFGDVTDERLAQLAYWAHMQVEEDLVAYAGPPVVTTPGIRDHISVGYMTAWNGIEDILDSQVARTGDPRENFLPPADTTAVDKTSPAALHDAIEDAIPVPDFTQMPGMENLPEGFKQILDLFQEISGMAQGDGFGPFTDATVTGPVHDDTPLEGDLFEIDADALTAALLSLRLNATVTVHDAAAEVTFPDSQRVFSVQAAGNKMAVVSHQTAIRDFSETTNAVPVTHDTIAAALWSAVGYEDGAFAHDGPYPPLPAYTPIEGGPGTTEPFAVIMTDPGDWPYNNAFVSDDAAILHRIEHDQSMPRDEVLQDVTEQMTPVGDNADSEGKWWASVNKALDERNIPDERRHEGIYY